MAAITPLDTDPSVVGKDPALGAAEASAISPIHQPSGAFLAAVGIPAGMHYGTDQQESVSGLVRVTPDYAELTLDEYRIWSLGLDPRPQHVVEAAGAELGIAAVPQLVHELTRQGLLAAFDGTVTTDRPLMEGLTLHFCGAGLGNSLAAPDRFNVVSSRGEPLVELGAGLFLLLLFSTSGQSLWQLCGQLADESGSDAQSVGHALLLSLPGLLSTGCAYLDRCR